jgi:hypothetical protein
MLASNMLTKDQMLEQYEVLGFAYGMCVVKRLSDGVKGTLEFGDFDVIHTNSTAQTVEDKHYQTRNGASFIGRTRYYYNFVEE